MVCPFSDFTGTESKVVTGLAFVALTVGLFKLTTATLSFLSMIFDLYILPPVNFSQYGAKKGNWALVTGASDGIGKEYARQIAKKGFNVVLVSRTKAKLEAVAKEIEGEFDVKTIIVAFDASKDVPESYEALKEAIKGLPITILINNVGKSHSMPVSFLDTDEKEMNDIITINDFTTLRVTRVVSPLILSTIQKQNGVRGLIVNMSSFAGLFPTPMLATYTGSKFFLQGWSAALAGELKPQNIDVECVLSYLVTSAMSKVRRTSFTVPNPKQFVASTLKNIGRRGGAQERYATITPYPSHALMHWAVANTVGVFSKAANHLNYQMHKSIRIRALRKAKRIAEANAKDSDFQKTE
ncbi:DEKNAAC101274 [Brettanomyces naardenensis]|uniref:Very-long-chain 3-oxoacyl-CoA reductase n=1 Tax=Brettanomyces naardenensis TaxID=13370 RepID=A0A448YHL7_BRENA|nr:DEKNAAC101274 [Brettanomyces naardenensis]